MALSFRAKRSEPENGGAGEAVTLTGRLEVEPAGK